MKERCQELEDELKKIKNRCLNSNSSLDSKKSDINGNNNHSANSDSGRWSTSDSEEGVLISNLASKTNQDENELIKKRKQQEIKKSSYSKLNGLMNGMMKKNNSSKEMNGLSKFKATNQLESKNDLNLDDFKDENSSKELNDNSTLNSTSKNGENVRNEDIFIYVPTIREKNSTKQSINPLTKLNSSRIFETNSNRTNKSVLNRFNSINCGLVDWKLTSKAVNQTKLHQNKNLSICDQELNKSQSNISSNSSTSSQKSNKPQIVNVYPKRSNSIGELLSDASKHSDDDKDDEEIKKLYCLRKQIAKSSNTLLKQEHDQTVKLSSSKSYKANLQNSIDALSTNNSLSEDNNEDYEELIASTLQQKRIKKNNKTIWSAEDDASLVNNNHSKIDNLRGSKLYASFANGQLNDKLKSDYSYNSSSLFRTGQYYLNHQNVKNNKSTSNLSNSSMANSQNACLNGEFYLMKGQQQSSVNSLNLIKNNHLGEFESLPYSIPPSIYGKHLNTLSKEKYNKTPQSELDVVNNQKHNSSTLQPNKKERNLTGKKIASQLQSYFFSGSISSKKKNEKCFNDMPSSKSTSNIKKQISDLNDKFPLPNAYKKNFILKGHQNVGYFSNNLPQDETNHSTSTVDLVNYRDESIKTIKPVEQLNSLSIHELQTKSSKSFKLNKKINKNDIELVENSCINLGLNSFGLTTTANSSSSSSQALNNNSISDVHREIALAAKELGAWY